VQSKVAAITVVPQEWIGRSRGKSLATSSSRERNLNVAKMMVVQTPLHGLDVRENFRSAESRLHRAVTTTDHIGTSKLTSRFDGFMTPATGGPFYLRIIPAPHFGGPHSEQLRLDFHRMTRCGSAAGFHRISRSSSGHCAQGRPAVQCGCDSGHGRPADVGRP